MLPARWHLLRNLAPAVQLAAHVAIGAACLAGVLLTFYGAERRSLTDAFKVWRTRTSGDKAN